MGAVSGLKSSPSGVAKPETTRAMVSESITVVLRLETEPLKDATTSGLYLSAEDTEMVELFQVYSF